MAGSPPPPDIATHLVGLGFIHTAVVEHGCLPCRHAAREQGTGSGTAAKQGRTKCADKACQGYGLCPFHACGNVALCHMGQLVGQHSRQFRFVLHLHEQTRVYEDIPAGHGEGVHAVVQEDIGVEREGLRRKGPRKTIHDGLDVALNFGIFHQRHA